MKKNVAGLCGFYFHFPVLSYTEKNRPIPAMKQSDTETIFRRCRLLHMLIRCLFGYSQFSIIGHLCADLVIRPEASFIKPDAGKRDRRNLPAVFISMSMEHRQCSEVSFICHICLHAGSRRRKEQHMNKAAFPGREGNNHLPGIEVFYQTHTSPKINTA